jgi:hypothetical protein
LIFYHAAHAQLHLVDQQSVSNRTDGHIKILESAYLRVYILR